MTKWISRASVMRIIDADPVYSDVINEKTYMASQISNLPTKEETSRPHGEWIPCSERLPEENKAVLVYVRRKDIKKSAMNGFYIATKHRMEGDPKGEKNFWGIPVAPCEWRIHGWSYFFEPDVVAWMPLPEPYKKEGGAK